MHKKATTKIFKKYLKNSTLPLSSNFSNIFTSCGSIIINIDQLGQYINSITQHSTQCEGKVTLIGEKRYGLASVLTSKCIRCDYKLSFDTSNKVKDPIRHKSVGSQPRSCLGANDNWGKTHKSVQYYGCNGSSSNGKGNFIRTEISIGEWWRKKINESVIEAGRYEKRLAEENGDYHQGVPTITVMGVGVKDPTNTHIMRSQAWKSL